MWRLGGLVGWVSDFSSGRDLSVPEFEPCVRFCADISEPEVCFGFCVSLSLSVPPLLALCLCLCLCLCLSKIKIKKFKIYILFPKTYSEKFKRRLKLEKAVQ